ncbi:GL19901 [Drosophila persimilis]|uniref:GL19901 n=1 Tax=Drosophila persimilis TaxID=7234 RepID=B4GYE0_DROPE|nr:GL19901 [Drosophila persimilis]
MSHITKVSGSSVLKIARIPEIPLGNLFQNSLSMEVVKGSVLDEVSFVKLPSQSTETLPRDLHMNQSTSDGSMVKKWYRRLLYPLILVPDRSAS